MQASIDFICDDKRDGGPPGPEDGPARPPSGRAARARRALIVEDDILAAQALAEIVQDWGIEPRAVRSADAAREAAITFDPGVAFVDVSLAGGFEGLELADWLETQCRCLVVLVTGHTARELRPRLRGREDMPVVFKPFDADALAHAVLLAAARRQRRGPPR